MEQNEILSRLHSMRDEDRSNLVLKTTVSNTIEKILGSVEDNNIKLKVNKVWTQDKYDNNDIKSQMIVRNRNQSWGDEVRADVSLIDKITGKEIDHVDNMKVSNIPKLTPRGTYLIKGNEYQFTKQARLKPGVYTRIQNNGEISSFFNVDKTIDFERGFNNNFKINFDPERKLFTMGYGSKNIPLYNVLRAVGVEDKEMKQMWGDDVYKANDKVYSEKNIVNQRKMYEAINGRMPASTLTPDDISNAIKERLFATELDPETTKLTLGKSFDKVDKGSLLTASKKIIDIHRGDVNPDDRDAIVFKSFYDADDHIREKLVKNSAKIINSIKHRLTKTRNLNKSLSSQTFDPFVLGTITTSQLSNPPGQTNLLSIIGENSKITVMGEGGIGSTNQISDEARQISNSEAGFIDPLHTPEGSNIGVAVHHTMGAIKLGNDLYSQFYDLKGDLKFLKPMDLEGKVVAFPDEYNFVNKKPTAKDSDVRAIKNGKIINVKPNEVDFIIKNQSSMFDTSTNYIPFLDSLQGNRGLTAAKMKEQALPLKYREKPLWRIKYGRESNLNKHLGGLIAIPKAPADGIVSQVTDEQIVITGKNGKKHNLQLYNNFPLNAESFIHNSARVKVGDHVKEGDVLADNNNTRNGELALGTNLRVAYIPWKGYNYEDSTIVSESAAKKLTSEHLYGFKAKRSSKGIFSRDKFKAYYPEETDSKKMAKLDKDGVIKPGTEVDSGDILIAHMERRAPTADDLALGRLDKQLKKDFANNAVKWDSDHKGIVTSVEKHGNNVTVNIKTEEELKVADKISGLHGNKHIVSKILPDHEMPRTESGKVIDITMSPIGVSNRINTSQILEAAAGKIAEKTGDQYEIENFRDSDNSQKMVDDMKKAGVSEKEYIIDPATGKKTKNPVMTGISHIIKLEHKVDHKFSARYREGYDSNEQPLSGGETGGKNIGRMELGALLARGAKENLKEMYNIKGQRNDEYWKALEMGDTLPPPKSPFVWKKMEAMMKGAGIDVEQEGKSFTLKPMTDRHILDLSSGELKAPTLTYRKKDLAPMKEGLFDPIKAGGMQGENYTHFKLPEKILNPIMAKAAATLIGIPETHLEDIVNGNKFVDPKSGVILNKPEVPGALSGGPAIEVLLKKIDMDKELKDATEKANTSKNSTQLNKSHSKIRYLKQLKRNDMKPTDYMIQNVLVVPPKYRPMFTMGTEGTVIMSDVNDLYQQASMTAETMKDLSSAVKETSGGDKTLENTLMAQIRGAMYQDVKALQGLREPTAYLHKIKDKKGFISQIDGGKKQTKEGFYQDKVVSRRQDLVGRSTIILNPDLGGDQVGIPKDMATKIFQPFIMKEIIGLGYTPLEAQKHIKDDTELFKKARQMVADKKLVILNRAPTLHRWNMTAFRPRLTDGKAVETPATVVSKFMGGDFDGDSIFVNVFISVNIKKLKKYYGKLKNIDFGSNFSYLSIDEYINQRKVIMPSKTKLPVMKGEQILHVSLQDFPRIEESKKITEKGTETYSVPEGVSIYTCDSMTKQVKLYPVTQFSIHPDLLNCVVEMKNGNEVLVSDDHSLVAMDMELGELKPVNPYEANGLAIPRVINFKPEEHVRDIELIDRLNGRSDVKVKNSIKATKDIGYFIGIMVGNGWADEDKGSICLASIHDNIGNEFSNTVDSMLDGKPELITQDNYHDFDGHLCYSKKFTKSCKSLSGNIVNWIGKGAHNKHLPPFFISTSEDFRIGLLSGLLDTDGTLAWAKAKAKTSEQFICSYSTMSERLATEIITLCRSLNIRASITITKAKGEYRLSISSIDIHNKNLKILNVDKAFNLKKFQEKPLTESQIKFGVAANDYVPFNIKFFNIAKKTFNQNNDSGMYSAIINGKCGVVTRFAAKKIVNTIPHLFPQWWIDVVNNESITWTIVKECRKNPNRVTMYDITVPGPYTFMTDCGIVVQDTMQIHVPISEKAQAEAERMLPSSDVLKTGYGTPLAAPDLDATVGSWLASRGKGGENKGKFTSIDEARKAYKSNKIDYSDAIEIEGKKAPLAMHEIKSILPDDVKHYDSNLTKSFVNNWISEVSKKHGDKIGLALADKIKNIGNDYSTQYGVTLGVSDTLSMKSVRDPILNPLMNKKYKNNMDMANDLRDAKTKISEELKKKYNPDSIIGTVLHSEGDKGIDNTAQITSAPVILFDANQKPIPMTIGHSYSEGLKTGEYWAAAHGARSGNIQKSVSSYKPGWLTSDVLNSVYSTRIIHEDAVDNQGIDVDVSDAKNIINRYAAQEVKDSKGKIIIKRNELIDSDALHKLAHSGIKTIHVQSPLTDPTPGDGISSYSYGVNYKNKRYGVGDNIGVISAHTITEPSLNMAMKAFHTGGAFNKNATAFDVLDRLFRFGQNIPDKATMTSTDGVVKDIKPSSIGGYDITVSNTDGDHTFYVVTGNTLKVKKGEMVKKGDMLSSGTTSIHDVIQNKGMKHAQRFLVNEIDDINDHKLDKRDIEVLVRGITNTTRVKKAIGVPYVAGDVAPLSTIEDYNRNRKREMDVEDAEGSVILKDYDMFKKGSIVTDAMVKRLQSRGIKRIEVEHPEILHEPFLAAGGVASKPSLQEDWIARLSHNRLKDVLQEGTSQGWVSDTSGAIHPLPNLVIGGR